MTTTVLHVAEQAISHCQRRISTRKTKRKPDMLHLRKPSLSNSVSSAASSSTSSTHSEAMHRHDLEFDPLLMHPAFHHPPARLQDRPFIVMQHDEEPPVTQEEDEEWRFLMGERSSADDIRPAKKTNSLPIETPTPMAHTGHQRQKSEPIGTEEEEEEEEETESIIEIYANEADDDTEGEQEPTDYFMMKTYRRPSRPAMPRSHWSESTIQTLDFSTPALTDSAQTPQPEPRSWQQTEEQISDDEEELAQSIQQRQESALERQIRQTRYQNFSYKRNTVPRRPPIKAVDSIENFIKRGGWKRRGIVFQQDPERPLSDVDVSPQPQLA